METENTTAQVKAGSSKKTMYIVIGVVILILIGLFLKDKSGSYVTPDGVNVNKNNDGSATYSNEQGTMNVGGNKYPDNWPSDVPKYANATIQYSGSSNPQTVEAGLVVVFNTTDSTDKVVEFYKKELTSNGWTIEQTATMGDVTIVAAKKGESTFGVQITSEDGKTVVTIGISRVK